MCINTCPSFSIILEFLLLFVIFMPYVKFDPDQSNQIQINEPVLGKNIIVLKCIFAIGVFFSFGLGCFLILFSN